VDEANSEFTVLESMFPRTSPEVYAWPFRVSADGLDHGNDAERVKAQRAILALWKRRIKAHQRRLRFHKLIIDLLTFRQQAVLFLLGLSKKPIAIAVYFLGGKHGQ
jgi:hypothetical protein